MSTSFLGLDIGTSSVKALLIDERQAIVAEHSVPLPILRPHPLWSEQDPLAWWSATCAAVAALRAQAPEAWKGVAGIGLSGQMHGATLLDAAGDVLRPAILWNDGRAGAECAELERRVPDLRQRAGNIAMAGFTAPKLLWVATNEPAIFAKVAKVLLPKDYVRFRMTGAYVSDMSDAAGTLWLDVARRRWDDTILAATGLSRGHMPDLVEGDAVSARLAGHIAADWGLACVPVAGGGGDNAASAIGIGAIGPGQGFLSLGTSGVLFAVTDRFVAKPDRTLHAFCHAVPNRWHGMSVILSAGASLSWLADLSGQSAAIPALLQRVEEWSKREANRKDAPIFLPYLSGERTPHNDPGATGQFAGLRSAHGIEALTYSVLEGVAFAFADGLEVLQDAGADLHTAMLVGGGARSALWASMLANTLRIPLQLPAAAEHGAAFGAARLAILAATGGDAGEVCTPPPVLETFEPGDAPDMILPSRLARFRALYQAERMARGQLA